MTNRPFVAIEGGIAAGKTTTGRLLAKQLGWTFVPEDFAANPILKTFYTDPERYATESHLAFLAIHAHQLNLHRDDRPLIADFSLVHGLSFCRMSVEPGLISTYEELALQLADRTGAPDLVIYLDVSPEIELDRIRARGRKMEKGITEEYLVRLRKSYHHYLDTLDRPVSRLTIDSTETPEGVVARMTDLISGRFPGALRSR
jgi:deoxyadenosine/deoxycytidine kinase